MVSLSIVPLSDLTNCMLTQMSLISDLFLSQSSYLILLTRCFISLTLSWKAKDDNSEKQIFFLEIQEWQGNPNHSPKEKEQCNQAISWSLRD